MMEKDLRNGRTFWYHFQLLLCFFKFITSSFHKSFPVSIVPSKVPFVFLFSYFPDPSQSLSSALQSLLLTCSLCPFKVHITDSISGSLVSFSFLYIVWLTYSNYLRLVHFLRMPTFLTGFKRTQSSGIQSKCNTKECKISLQNVERGPFGIQVSGVHLPLADMAE